MFTKIKPDVNGNPRYVCHYVNLLSAEDSKLPLNLQYSAALYNSRALGGKKFHNKQYGGGIVFSTYNLKDLEKDIKAISSSV